MGPWQIFFLVACVAGGAWLACRPFLLEYHLLAKVLEAQGLSTAVAQLPSVERLASQIGSTTAQWQQLQQDAGKTAASAREISERMSSEVRAFTDFVQRANDSEKANLRLEIEKLRRAESDWLHVVVRQLDHVYALHQGALRSGQKNVIDQITHFQNACRDNARRVGLAAVMPAAGEPFDPQKHQLLEETEPPQPGAKIEETIATGYTLQSKPLRRALVRLAPSPAPLEPAPPHPQPALEPAPAAC